jgi:hypothetical protein
MSAAALLLGIGVALGAAGYLYPDRGFSGGGFASAIAALVVWVISNRRAQGGDADAGGIDIGNGGGGGSDGGGGGDGGGGDS